MPATAIVITTTTTTSDERNQGRASHHDGRSGNTAFVSDYVRQGVNAPTDFNNPDNLALDKGGNLYITEDTTTPPGMDIWTAFPSGAGGGQRKTRSASRASPTAERNRAASTSISPDGSCSSMCCTALGPIPVISES